MKVTYLERIDNHTALDRKKFCFNCGAHEYDVVEQLEPQNPTPWFVRCPQCGAEGPESPARDIAIARWKQMNLC